MKKILHPPEYFHVRANIGGSYVSVEGPHDNMEEALQRIRELRKESVNFSIVKTRCGYDAEEVTVESAEKRKRRRVREYRAVVQARRCK